MVTIQVDLRYVFKLLYFTDQLFFFKWGSLAEDEFYVLFIQSIGW